MRLAETSFFKVENSAISILIFLPDIVQTEAGLQIRALKKEVSASRISEIQVSETRFSNDIL